MILEIDSPSGSLAAYSKTPDDESAFYTAIDRYCHMDESIINDLLLYVDEECQCPGFLANIRVSSNTRGQGFGKNLMSAFQESFSHHTTMDFLIAHIENPQANGFQLLNFYKKYGFEPVIHQDGMVLMANKGWAPKLKREVFPHLMPHKSINAQSDLSI